jgi:hypothetical protein
MIQEIANNLNGLSGAIALLAFLVSIAALYVSIKSLSGALRFFVSGKIFKCHFKIFASRPKS